MHKSPLRIRPHAGHTIFSSLQNTHMFTSFWIEINASFDIFNAFWLSSPLLYRCSHKIILMFRKNYIDFPPKLYTCGQKLYTSGKFEKFRFTAETNLYNFSPYLYNKFILLVLGRGILLYRSGVKLYRYQSSIKRIFFDFPLLYNFCPQLYNFAQSYI